MEGVRTSKRETQRVERQRKIYKNRETQDKKTEKRDRNKDEKEDDIQTEKKRVI